MTAAASPSGAMALPRSAIFRLATVLLCTLATLLVTGGRAFAASKAAKAAAKTAASSAPLLSGDVIKWGVLALFAGGAILLSSSSGESTNGSGFQYVEDDEPPVQKKPPASIGRAVDAAAVEAADEATPFDSSDNSLSSALSARMQALAEEKLQENEEAVNQQPNDSTDEWGTGSTAVLEPPRPDAPSGSSGPDFPVGFPLRDFEEEDVAPSASQDEIAMLERMFGTRSE